MFIPPYFSQNDPSALQQLMQDNPLATLVVQTDAGLSAHHLPLFVEVNDDQSLTLQGHVANANDVWKEDAGDSVLAIFQGAQSYISPNWYPSKKEHGKAVPTWNYIAVHAKGEICFIHDDDWKRQFLERLTNQQEASQSSPWSVSDAPEAYTQAMLKAIVGFEIKVGQLEGKWKLSQNQPPKNKQGIQQALEDAGQADASLLSGLKE